MESNVQKSKAAFEHDFTCVKTKAELYFIPLNTEKLHYLSWRSKIERLHFNFFILKVYIVTFVKTSMATLERTQFF